MTSVAECNSASRAGSSVCDWKPGLSCLTSSGSRAASSPTRSTRARSAVAKSAVSSAPRLSCGSRSEVKAPSSTSIGPYVVKPRTWISRPPSGSSRQYGASRSRAW
ncbi:hypothetical protein [Kitasatospora fiedleri]|uniref:hypothetical protein n=1 Tax=Kitasatospora fiedleri TaxID=2991545 RepID=UPI00249B0916|nr:hypothetical protein [Kitasatospora fiedleri]